MKTEEKIIKLLKNKQKTLSIAESCTGGLMAVRLTDVPGSSAVLMLGVVTYSNEAKVKVLGIPENLIKKKGAVCDDVAMAMAANVRKIHNTDFGIGITGIAGPGGATKTKPVGLVYIAVATKIENLCLQYEFTGTRTQIRQKASTEAMKLLLEFLD